MTTLTLNDDFLKSENLDNNLQKNIEKKAIISINKLELSQFTNYRLKTKNNQLDLNCLEKSLSSIKQNRSTKFNFLVSGYSISAIPFPHPFKMDTKKNKT